ncbi:FtsK/SpoIIIE domain-containing protein [Sinosporangium siamense]|uniref:FtsK/SpoIIIE domain-containing protein n=1 Tax=Sinosporangium siamense TaxID=1367973 RepID=UPI001EF2A14A|nr:FtsK/SpoIIIE domain-containing protein [Sinosporangium siamense]
MSTRPDTSIVYTPTVFKTPAILVVLAWTWRLVAGTAKTVVRHPIASALVWLGVAVGLLWGWRAVAGGVAGAGIIASIWAGVSPRTFMRYAGWRVVSWWRWMWVYRRHWGGVMAVAGLVRSVRGTGYVPDLVKVVSSAAADTVTVRMLRGQSLEEFADRVANLAHGFGADLAVVRSLRAGWVTLVFPRRDLLAVTIPARPLPVLPEVDSVEIGVCEGGEPYRLRLHGTHVLIAGATGSGKGSWLWSIVRGLLPAQAAGRAEIWGLDPKRMEFAYGKGLFTRYAATPAGCADLLETAVAAMQERADRYAGVQRFHVATRRDPFVVIVIDEVAFLTAYQPDKGLRLRITAALATLTTQGRAVGFSVVAALQDPRKDVLAIRNLFPVRVALRLDEPDQVDMVLGDGARDRGALADQIPHDSADPEIGAGTGYVRRENSPDPARVRAALVTDADIEQMSLRYSAARDSW